jgi:hypothetical protein
LWELPGELRCSGESRRDEAEAFDAPLGFPGRQMTKVFSTMAARLRERIAFLVIFMDSMRMTSPNPGSSRMAISRTASGVTSRKGDAGAAGGEDEVATASNLFADSALDSADFVRNNCVGDDFPGVTFGGFFEGGATEVVVFAFGSAVGNGDDSNVKLHIYFFVFETRWMFSMRIVLSMALHMS